MSSPEQPTLAEALPPAEALPAAAPACQNLDKNDASSSSSSDSSSSSSAQTSPEATAAMANDADSQEPTCDMQGLEAQPSPAIAESSDMSDQEVGDKTAEIKAENHHVSESMHLELRATREELRATKSKYLKLVDDFDSLAASHTELSDRCEASETTIEAKDAEILELRRQISILKGESAEMDVDSD